jgi:bacillithiol system protein YtxJ
MRFFIQVIIKECKNEQDFGRILNKSNELPVFLLKHSTACPISKAAYDKFEKFAENREQAEFYMVLVIEDRRTSLFIAEKTGIKHESPQAILFVKGKAVWSASHWEITYKNLDNTLKNKGSGA